MQHEMEIKINRKSNEKGYVAQSVYYTDSSYIADIVLGFMSSIKEIKVIQNTVVTERCVDDR